MMVPCVTFYGLIQTVRLLSQIWTWSLTHAPEITGWGLSPRGAGFLFGGDVVKQFARSNDIELLARAHQLAMEGYKHMFDNQIVTVWSAPNYCYRYEIANQLTHVYAEVFISTVAAMLPQSLSWMKICGRSTKCSTMPQR